MSNKRWALLGIIALAAALVLSACGGAVQTVVVTQLVEGEAPTPEPVEAPDTIIICMSQEPDSLYQMVSTMAVSSQVAHAFGSRGWIPDRAFGFETQMLVNNEFPSFENGGAVVDDAGTPDLGDDVITVTFQFKDNITWSDGEPFTVDDWLYTRDVLLDPDSGATTRGTIESQTWTKIDDYTMSIALAAGVRDPLYYLPPLTGPFNDSTTLLPEHVLGEMAPADIVTSDYARAPNPVLGPYQVTEWVEGDHVSLTAVENWWGGEVVTPNLIYRFISDTNQLLASVLSGECDYATSDGLQLTQLPFIQQSADQGLVQYDAIPSIVWEHIDMNVWPVEPSTENDGAPFFADVRVRQAVAYGTNRLQMTEQILYGEVTPLTSNLPSDHWAWNPETEGMYAYDPEQAKALLAEAGWADGDGDGVVEASSELTGEYSCDRGPWTMAAGTPFEVAFHTTTGNAMRQQLSTIFQSNMADIGIKINLELLPASVWFADDGPMTRRQYQIGEFAWVSTADPGSLSLYSGINIYRTPDGQFLTADKVLAAAEAAGLDLSGVDTFTFMHGRPAAEDLPEGLTLHYPEQIQSEGDNWEGQNNMGWCSPEATQAQFNGGNEIANADRLPFYLEFQKIFADEVPTVPLFQRVEVEAWVNGLCGPNRGPANLATWNVETWYFDMTGAGCQ